MSSVKNITLSAEESLIQKARRKAQEEDTSLNQRFREWLVQYVGATIRDHEYNELMESFNYARPGKRFTRDEMNER